MLLSLLALAVAFVAICVSHKLADNITRLLMKLVGLFSLAVSLVYSAWFIKLFILATIFLTPACDRQHNLRRVRCPPVCIARSDCPLSSL